MSLLFAEVEAPGLRPGMPVRINEVGGPPVIGVYWRSEESFLGDVRHYCEVDGVGLWYLEGLVFPASRRECLRRVK